jgi:Immunoglobulin I-set domain.
MPLQELKSDDLIRIDNVDYNTKFFILRAKRLHNGKYTIIAKNSVGEDRVDFDITVLGKYKDSDKKNCCKCNTVLLYTIIKLCHY